jgi:uncharacterized membrane protein
MWDFLWFVLNPGYTLKNYKKEKIWWFSNSKWVFNLFPSDYLFGFLIATGITIIRAIYSNSYKIITDYISMLIILAILVIITILLSPKYHKWHKKMVKNDERKLSRIFH